MLSLLLSLSRSLLSSSSLSSGLGWICLGIAGAHFAHYVLAIHLAGYLVILGYVLEAVFEFRNTRHVPKGAHVRQRGDEDR